VPQRQTLPPSEIQSELSESKQHAACDSKKPQMSTSSVPSIFSTASQVGKDQIMPDGLKSEKLR